MNQILPTWFTLRDDESRIIAVMTSNVDDVLYGYRFEGAEVMKSVLQQFLVGEEERSIFRFVGKNSNKTKTLTFMSQPITYDMKHGLTREEAPDEIHQLRSVTQSLAWIARQTRLDSKHF